VSAPGCQSRPSDTPPSTQEVSERPDHWPGFRSFFNELVEKKLSLTNSTPGILAPIGRLHKRVIEARKAAQPLLTKHASDDTECQRAKT
jgi:hypothetical protein